MTRGGKRDGAGRPESEITKQVRIPVSMAGIARELADIYKERLTEKLHDERWFKNAPEHEKTLIAFENTKIGALDSESFFYGNLNAETRDELHQMNGVLCVIAEARHPNGDRATVWVKI